MTNGDVPAHCMTMRSDHYDARDGLHCSCGSAFDEYYALADHVRQFMTCPRCGATPANLGEGELYRWRCGHWIARDDASATIRTDEERTA